MSLSTTIVSLLPFIWFETAPPSMKTVTFETSDGVQIEADYYPPIVEEGAKAPVAILIHMYPADRKSWRPIVDDLRTGDAHFAVLAYDIRGRGGSTRPENKNLAARYQRRDSELFNNAWRDVEAAKKWLSQRKECDTGRIALIGASIGCSIAMHYGSRDGAVKAIVCLSPGTNYFGVDSLSHIKKCERAKVLLMSPGAEYSAVRQLVQASGGKAKGLKFSGGRERHGTGMFAEDYEDAKAAKKAILSHVTSAIGKKGK